MINRLLLMAAVFGFCVEAFAVEFDLKRQVDIYKQMYNLKNPYDKLVDNRGDGYDGLYGVRNFRVVLHGIYYRGGANNKYNRINKRPNQNPLQNHALKNLCKNGFSEALYLYRDNFSSANANTDCRDFENDDQNLKYNQSTAFDSSNQEKFINTVFRHIKGNRPGPLYAHCWNGWHASGMIAAMALQQFCGWSPQQALKYWTVNTDGNSSGYDSVKKRILEFKPYPQYQITSNEKNLICP
jgi:hypothetical protein